MLTFFAPYEKKLKTVIVRKPLLLRVLCACTNYQVPVVQPHKEYNTMRTHSQLDYKILQWKQIKKLNKNVNDSFSPLHSVIQSL